MASRRSRAPRNRLTDDKVISMRIAKISVYVIGLSVVGFVGGFFAGGSGSPVVGVVLPLIFSLIGGASGMFIGKADLSNDADVSRMALLGLSLLAFSTMLWFGAVSGASSRLSKSISSIVFPDMLEVGSIKRSRTVTEAIALSLLRAKIASPWRQQLNRRYSARNCIKRDQRKITRVAE